MLRDYLEKLIGCGHIKGDVVDLLNVINERHKNGSDLTVEEAINRYAEACKSK